MTNLKIHRLLVFLLISFSSVAGADQLSKIFLVESTDQVVAMIYQKGRLMENESLNLRSFADRELLQTLNSDEFEKPVVFRYHGEKFVHVSTTPAGSGAFVTDTVFWVSPDAAMHEIQFESAVEDYQSKVGPQKTVLSGGSGVNCNKGKLTFEFYIANDGDAHCCPTGGKVTGNYKIIGKKHFDPITKQYSSTFRMVVEQYSRIPITKQNMSADYAE